MKYFNFVLLILALFLSCDSESKRKHQLMHDAEDLQKIVLDEYQNVSDDITNSKANVEDDSKFSNLSQRLLDVKKNLDLVKTEVHHDHGAEDGEHVHNAQCHHGSSKVQLTAEDRIIVLNEFLDTIKQIKAELVRN